jgi:Xaa-Pro aminopeptidase
MSIYADRLRALRAELARLRLDGFVVPLTDEHMSEYVGAYAQGLGWLTGFQGSAGTAVVLAEAAAIFTDGRYTIQVREQVSPEEWSYQPVPETSVAAWLGAHAAAGARIAYDPWLHTRGWVEAAKRALAGRGAELVAVDDNPIDAIWAGKPAPSDARMVPHDERYAGLSSAAKRQDMADLLAARGADAAVITALDSIAWTFNLRGHDVDRTPVALAFAAVHADATADLFVAPGKAGEDVLQALGNTVRVHPRAAFPAFLRGLGGKAVLVDPDRTVAAVAQALDEGGARVIDGRDPAVLPKAIKNGTEIAGSRAAHLRDGVALTTFLHWIAQEAPAGTLTEASAAARLEVIRRAMPELRDLSFDTISASGPNGAIPHYRVTAESSRPIETGTLYLVDSGGQFPDGTTDVTRTVAVGEPTAEMRDRFTRVLKGHIALACAVFPEGTRGNQIDGFARQFLWEVGLDYAHGTGHGVGSFLSVHEGPARIATFNGGDEPLRAGMILSNEPGFYKEGHWGIRIENLVLVEPREIEGATRSMLGFETLTLAPIDRRLIDPALLTAGEREWLDAYHARVRVEIGPLVDPEVRAWLEGETQPL